MGINYKTFLSKCHQKNMALLETLIICSLIANAPFYDCENKWTIFIYDEKGVGHNCRDDAMACAKYTSHKYDGEIHIPADYNKVLLSVSKEGYKQYCINCTDWCGHNVLWHEIQHLIVRQDRWNDDMCNE